MKLSLQKSWRHIKYVFCGVCVLMLPASGLYAAEPVLTETVKRVSDERKISGKVTSGENDMGIPGVHIVVKGTMESTVTDFDGNFSIMIKELNPTEVVVLQISAIGFITQEVEVRDQSNITVVLAEDVQQLEEIVVVGYGVQKKSDVTGAVAVLKVDDLKTVSTNDVGQMLQGRTPGVQVNSDGQAGAFPQVRIRGIGTFGNSDPLYVIDGVPISGVPRDFNPNDIETMQVLKDASAGAIYGSRAANGVIIITTKKGKRESPLKVEYNSYYGVDEVWQTMPVTSRANYQTLNNEARYNDGKLLAPANNPESVKYIDDVDTDWQAEGLKQGMRQNHNLSFSGGSSSSTYNVSLDYFENQGTYEGNGPNYQRYTARVNTTQEKGRFRMGQSFFYAKSNEDALVSGAGVLAGAQIPLVNYLVTAIPTMRLYDDTKLGGYGGTLSDREDAISVNGIGYNSLITSTTDVDRIFASGYGELELFNKKKHSLKYKVNVSVDKTMARDYVFIPEFDLGYFHKNDLARVTDNSREYTAGLVENTLTYDFSSGKHNLNVLVGQMYQSNETFIRYAGASGYEEPYFPTLENGQEKSSGAYQDKSVLSSYLSRVNYSFDDRYLLTATLRRDGSSKFSPSNKFGYFPSLAIGWKLLNEDFMEFMPSQVSSLKLRASWGILGNENIGNYAYSPLINPNVVYTFTDESGNEQRLTGAIQTNVVSETLKWEEKETTNIGLDVELFDGQVLLSGEYYNSVSRDILVGVPIPASVGSLNAAPIVNAGTLRNRGVEVAVNYRRITGDFQWDIGANISSNRNKVLALGENVNEVLGAGSITTVGSEIGRHYGFKTDGIFQTQEEIDNHAYQEAGTSVGDIKFVDLSGPDGTPDGVIDAYDRTDLGSALPKFTYGLSFSAEYKNFDFTMFASGAGKYLINNALYRQLMHTGGDDNYHLDMLDRWTSTNTDTNIPRLVWSDPNGNGRDSDREGWLQDGTHLRISTISLGYNVPTEKVEWLSKARVYMTAQNLYTFQTYKGYNPDFTSGVWNPGFDAGSYPKPRTIMLGVQLGF
ncbi:TonB-dependent receptor [Limibacter armeniacum]|uniref:SusC/RagA family TonB-linked outer membrane protein n=1 Tax=Limibacter armeniacum TaxID=466084 RepID=UPI002FE56F0B